MDDIPIRILGGVGADSDPDSPPGGAAAPVPGAARPALPAVRLGEVDVGGADEGGARQEFSAASGGEVGTAAGVQAVQQPSGLIASPGRGNSVTVIADPEVCVVSPPLAEPPPSV